MTSPSYSSDEDFLRSLGISLDEVDLMADADTHASMTGIFVQVWNRHPGQRLIRTSPIPEFAPVSSVNQSSSSDSELDSDSVEMADNTKNEIGFSEAQIRTIAQIVAAALAQDRAQNHNTPPSGSQPVAEERPIPEPVSDNQASVGNTVPIENDVLKQLADLKERFDKMAAVKEKNPVSNFQINLG
ncbi:hypothetical protein JCGZ_06365 [Jatropha curcas]|uniref:Uncharacterized protein n=1 Tax=Jatropha curcas TaxID=180498 RepID=A0A067KS91_JATCU|nr:hypothetical protein JCGZ_06365 [Jatropha curcas]